jgi:hypothetical protein
LGFFVRYKAAKGVNCMNYVDIERLKYALANFVRQGCRVKIPHYGVDGKVVGVGFKPYWTKPFDSKIDKLELNIMDDFGRIFPFNFNYITGYEIMSHDGERFEDSRSANLDIFIYSPNSTIAESANEKVRLEIAGEPVK